MIFKFPATMNAGPSGKGEAGAFISCSHTSTPWAWRQDTLLPHQSSQSIRLPWSSQLSSLARATAMLEQPKAGSHQLPSNCNQASDPHGITTQTKCCSFCEFKWSSVRSQRAQHNEINLASLIFISFTLQFFIMTSFAIDDGNEDKQEFNAPHRSASEQFHFFWASTMNSKEPGSTEEAHWIVISPPHIEGTARFISGTDGDQGRWKAIPPLPKHIAMAVTMSPQQRQPQERQGDHSPPLQQHRKCFWAARSDPSPSPHQFLDIHFDPTIAVAMEVGIIQNQRQRIITSHCCATKQALCQIPWITHFDSFAFSRDSFSVRMATCLDWHRSNQDQHDWVNLIVFHCNVHKHLQFHIAHPHEGTLSTSTSSLSWGSEETTNVPFTFHEDVREHDQSQSVGCVLSTSSLSNHMNQVAPAHCTLKNHAHIHVMLSTCAGDIWFFPMKNKDKNIVRPCFDTCALGWRQRWEFTVRETAFTQSNKEKRAKEPQEHFLKKKMVLFPFIFSWGSSHKACGLLRWQCFEKENNTFPLSLSSFSSTMQHTMQCTMQCNPMQCIHNASATQDKTSVTHLQHSAMPHKTSVTQCQKRRRQRQGGWRRFAMSKGIGKLHKDCFNNKQQCQLSLGHSMGHGIPCISQQNSVAKNHFFHFGLHNVILHLSICQWHVSCCTWRVSLDSSGHFSNFPERHGCGSFCSCWHCKENDGWIRFVVRFFLFTPFILFFFLFSFFFSPLSLLLSFLFLFFFNL